MGMQRGFPAMVAGLGLVLALGACGGGEDALTNGDTESPTAAAGGELTVGGAAFTEMAIMQEIYKLLLEDAGYTVDIQQAEARELYAPALESGEIDVVPEYAATMAEYLNREKNGPEATPIATADAAETVAAMAPIAEEYGLTVLEPAQAADQNGFAVSKEFAAANGDLTTLTELGALSEPLVLAAGDECAERPFCQPGLETTYGIEITEILPLGFSTQQTKEAVAGGEAQLGLVATTDGTLESYGLVLLEDDKELQRADNLVPVVNTSTAGDSAIAEALNQLADVLTTEDLAKLNAQVDVERQEAADVAQAYLEEKGLIGG
jgi:osmoprotectant transport system substrate-binding protein